MQVLAIGFRTVRCEYLPTEQHLLQGFLGEGTELVCAQPCLIRAMQIVLHRGTGQGERTGHLGLGKAFD